MRGGTLDNDQLARQIDELEQYIRHDDSSLWERISKLERARTRNDIAVFTLLAVSAVLLAIALTATSLVAGCGGVAAYLASFLVDRRHQRKLRRASWRSPLRRRRTH